MTDHVAGIDVEGPWAACYGFVEWMVAGSPGRMSISRVLYRDRLREDAGGYVIAHRELTVLMMRRTVPFAEHTEIPGALLDLR